MKPKHAPLAFLLVAGLFSVLLQPLRAQVAQTHRVEITDFQFVPEIIKARAGDQIVFLNRDVVPHTATQKPAGSDSGSLKEGETWSLTVEKAGALDIFCRFHPSMTARIVIE